ncbi:probable polygalacturonase isoform X3 [Durio zibethinus]|uniref:Probable polygalacturonase isoform X3 n=1 Tax=Durio zibethinus TaxID=66656 RepID=A0A6P6A718_DURZI|nr:probable polygalacturonase isoform X3 [Durio zibethinus]
MHERSCHIFLNRVALLLLLALCNAIKVNGEESNGQCFHKLTLDPRPHSVSILEFGAVGDGKTLNTIAFQNAIFYLKSFADKGGAQLYVPPGRWLTESFNLTSHLTLFLEKGAVILGSQDPSHWDIVEPLPSYGRGIELPGGRYRSLVNGYMLRDVIITDSSDNVCIEDCNISMGHDAIALKSGWDEYGIAYGRPTTNVHVRRVHLQSSSGSSLAFGSEMSGGISNVQVEQVHLYNSLSGIEFRTARGRGGYIKEIIVSDVDLLNMNTAFSAIGDYGFHPDDKFDPHAFPVLEKITLQNIVGTNITVAGNFTGIQESPFTSICLSNISLSINAASSTSWVCSYVSGFSDSVFPEPCPDLENSTTSSSCFFLLKPNGKAAVL